MIPYESWEKMYVTNLIEQQNSILFQTDDPIYEANYTYSVSHFTSQPHDFVLVFV